MSVKHSEAIDRANRGWNPPQILNMLLIRDPLFENRLAFAFELAEEIQYELVEIFDGELGIFAQSCSLMLHDILSIHVQLVDLSASEIICESGLLVIAIELILGRVLARRDKDNRLIQS
jgi:hypothetical protein